MYNFSIIVNTRIKKDVKRIENIDRAFSLQVHGKR